MTSPPPPANSTRVEILDAAEFRRTLTRLASEIVEQHPDLSRVMLVGIRTRGVPLATRLAHHMSALYRLTEFDSSQPESQAAAPVLDVGALDITFYRDDLMRSRLRTPNPSDIPGDLTDRQVVLVDDVIYSGRTIRAALEALNDFGRPECVRLAVLVDRGHRELPIHPDYVGKVLPTSDSELVRVRLTEVDGSDLVFIEQP